MKKFLNFDRVLCLSPHPDDVEYSMSGVIHECPGTQFLILNMSEGTPQDKTSGHNRILESETFWSKWPAPNQETVSVCRAYVRQPFQQTETEWVSWIEDRFSGNLLDAIIGPSGIDSHPEHKIANNLLAALGRHKPLSLVEYKTSSTLPGWIPNYHHSINQKTLQAKIQLLPESYVSQADGLYFKPDLLRAFHQDFYQLKRGVAPCESFRIQVMYDR